MCVKEKEHIDIPFLREAAPEKIGYAMDIFVCVFNILTQLGLAAVSIGWIQKTGSSVSPGLKIPYYFIYSLFPVCLVLMAIYTVRRLAGIIKERKAKALGGNK
jgi:TRAP-type C4-dicarboxylate transport system permease small subunit